MPAERRRKPPADDGPELDPERGNAEADAYRRMMVEVRVLVDEVAKSHAGAAGERYYVVGDTLVAVTVRSMGPASVVR